MADETDKAAAEAAAPKAKLDIVPLLAVVVLVPVLCYVVMDFVVVPRLKKTLSPLAEGDAPAAEVAHKAEPAHKAEGKEGKSEGKKEGKSEGKKEGGKGGKGGEVTVDFGSTIVNLVGTGGTRYLKVNFVLAGSDEHLDEKIKNNHAALQDAALSVLSTQTVSTLEAAGGKNLVRNEIITQFNRKLGGQYIEQLYFSEFVIQ